MSIQSAIVGFMAGFLVMMLVMVAISPSPAEMRMACDQAFIRARSSSDSLLIIKDNRWCERNLHAAR